MSRSVDVHVFWHYRQFNFCHFFSDPFFGSKYYGQCMFQGKHIVGGGFTNTFSNLFIFYHGIDRSEWILVVDV